MEAAVLPPVGDQAERVDAARVQAGEILVLGEDLLDQRTVLGHERRSPGGDVGDLVGGERRDAASALAERGLDQHTRMPREEVHQLLVGRRGGVDPFAADHVGEVAVEARLVAQQLGRVGTVERVVESDGLGVRHPRPSLATVEEPDVPDRVVAESHLVAHR